MMKIITQKVTLIVVPFILSTLVQANSIDAYLFAHHDKNLEAKEALFTEYAYKRNYIEKIRAKVDFSHFTKKETKYSLQAFPKNMAQVEIEEQIYNTKKAYIQNGQADSKILRKRYETLLDAWYQKQRLSSLNVELALYHDKVEIANAMIKKRSDIMNVTKFQHKLHKLELKSFKMKQVYTSLLKQMQADANLTETLDDTLNVSSFVNIDTMLSNMHDIVSTSYHLPQDRAAYKLDLLEKKVALDEAKDSWQIRSFDIDFDDSKSTGNAYSVGMSIEIPLAGNDNAKHLANRIKVLEAKEKMALTEDGQKAVLSRLVTQMKDLKAYAQKIKESYVDVHKYHKFSTLGGVNPQFILNLKSENLELDDELLKVQNSMYKTYIKFLALSGNLVTANNTNVLAVQK